MPAVNREELLKTLTSVMPGLSPRPVLEQSDCFAFTGGRVVTFNGDAACWTTCKIALEGAVPARPLLDSLKARPEETLDMTVEKTHLVFRGKGQRKTWIHLEPKVTLPIPEIPAAKTWINLPGDFLEAVDKVHRCCGKNQEKLETFVHIHPQHLEAIGDGRFGHYRMQLAIPTDSIVQRESIKHIVDLGMNKMALSDKWIQFRNPKGVVLSCAQWEGKQSYPDVTRALKLQGERITLPRGLDAAVQRAAVFTQENAENDEVLIQLRAGQLWVMGTGISGGHQEPRKVEYSGPALKFRISPKLLCDLCHQHTEAWLTSDILKVKSGKFTFITGLRADGPKQTADGEETQTVDSEE